MKKFIKEILTYLITCSICEGLGFTEISSGDTKECTVCKGKGFI